MITQVSYSEMAVPASASLLDCIEIEFVVDFRNSSHDPEIFSFLHRNVGTVHSSPSASTKKEDSFASWIAAAQSRGMAPTSVDAS